MSGEIYHVGVTIMERLDQDHLHPLLEHPGQTWDSNPCLLHRTAGELSSKELLEHLVNNGSDHLYEASAAALTFYGRSTHCVASLEWRRLRRGSQRDVVYLGRPIAPSYLSPFAGGGGELRGLSQCEYSCTHVA
jgi:hypothetical protein